VKCYIVQHGQATSKEENPVRPLSEQGIYDIQCLSRILQQKHIQPAHIFHSDKERAIQTATIIADILGLSDNLKQIEGIAPMDDAHEFALKIKPFADDVLLISHMPFVQRLCDELLGDKRSRDMEFVPGKCVCFEIDRGRAELLWQS